MITLPPDNKLDREQALTNPHQFSPGISIGPYDNLEAAYSDLAFLKYSLGVVCHVAYRTGDPYAAYYIAIDEDRTSRDY